MNDEFRQKTIEKQNKGKKESQAYKNRFNNEQTRNKLSEKKKQHWNNMTEEQRKARGEAIRQGQLRRYEKMRQAKENKGGQQLELF